MFVEHKEAGEAQTAEQANRKLKLSDAMRIGAKLRPQSTSGGFAKGTTCAIVAAAEGLGFDLGASPPSVTAAAWDFLKSRGVVDEPYHATLAATIISHNDFDEWTREQIADWLEAQGL
jgi:hypothetical protein